MRLRALAGDEGAPRDDREALTVRLCHETLHTVGICAEAVARTVRRRARGLAVLGRCGLDLTLVLRADVETAAARELLERALQKLSAETHLQGLPCVTEAQVRRVRGSAHGDACADALVVELAGATLQEAMKLPCVRHERTLSNNVTDVLDTLGIEAARTVLLRELQGTIAYDGTYVNGRHLQLLSDAMTVRGYVMPMSRHGINRGGTEETLKMCSYEETMEVLGAAALYGRGDNMHGITPNVAFGQGCRAMGTAAADVMYDERALPFVGAGVRLPARATPDKVLVRSCMQRFGKAIARAPVAARSASPRPAARATRPSAAIDNVWTASAGRVAAKCYVPPSPRTEAPP